jgi:hypothetical protein
LVHNPVSTKSLLGEPACDGMEDATRNRRPVSSILDFADHSRRCESDCDLDVRRVR